jgi:anti-sigma B factor antagonist
MPPPVLALLAADTLDGCPILTVRGELDVGTAPALRAWLNAATRDGSRSAIVDLSAVTFMAVAALHALRDEQERLVRKGHRLTIVADHPQLLALFELVAADRLMDVVPTRRAARAGRTAVRPREHLARWRARGSDESPPEAS